MLKESIFFTARPAIPPSHGAADLASASERALTLSHCGHYCKRVCTPGHGRQSGMSESESEIEDSKHSSTEPEQKCHPEGMSETEAEIEASKHSWTEPKQKCCPEGMSETEAEIKASKHSWTEPKQKCGPEGMSETEAEIEASKHSWTEPKQKCCPEGMSETEAEIEASKYSSTEPEQKCCPEGMSSECGMTEEKEKLYNDGVEAIKELIGENPWSKFFVIDEKGKVELGTIIAEGGQGTIHEVGPDHSWEGCYGRRWPVVRKVFKEGYTVRDLQKQWPIPSLHRYTPVNEGLNEVAAWNFILNGRLLGDGRFAFDMARWWGDLQKLLNKRMQHNGNQRPPFMQANGNYHECCMLMMMGQLADGMMHMHSAGIAHRDLKAANVLIESAEYVEDPDKRQLDPLDLKHDFICFIADFECSIGIEGTGFWRAPEILEALRQRNHREALEVTQQSELTKYKMSDVYSFAMLCYEILTGYMPFEDEDNLVTGEDVIKGKRPKLPAYLKPWMENLLKSCWEKDPLKRPTFQEIRDIFKSIAKTDLGCRSESDFYTFHRLGFFEEISLFDYCKLMLCRCCDFILYEQS